MKYKVLVADGISAKGKKIFENESSIELDLRSSIDASELLKIISDYHFLVVRSATKVTKEVLDAGSNLKIIGRAGAGVDNIDVAYASEKGIWVENTPGGNSHAVAELVLGMMFSLARHISFADASMKSGKWEKKKFKGTEIKGKTLGIVGLGKIGSDVAKMSKLLGMDVIAFDPVLSSEKFSEYGAKQVELEELFSNSDYITLHLPSNEKTKNLINKDTISKMKDGVYLINCARGGIVNESDLKDALESGKVAGAGFDVYSKEPVESDNPLLTSPNIVLTPHVGASSVEAQDNVSIMIAEQIVAYCKENKIINSVNKI